MPELPEVETVKSAIEPQLIGRKITDVTAHCPQVLARPDAEDFCCRATDAIIKKLGRRGKFLEINLENGDTIITHLRMTGQLYVTPKGYPQEKHTHIIFHLDDGQELRYVDYRRFGRLWLKRKGEEDTFSGISRLGPEPFAAEFNAVYLKTALGRRRKVIKQCLLDQNIVAGIGNIYADEVLFAAKIRPDRPADSLKKKQWELLAETIPQILKQAIELNKISAQEFLEEKGRGYRSTPFFKVYGHEGEPCPCCGKPLTRMVISGRSSCYCSKCQK